MAAFALKKVAYIRLESVADFIGIRNMNDDIALEMRSINKHYAGVKALNDVSIRIHKAKVNVLVGENGAGKSTLMKIL